MPWPPTYIIQKEFSAQVFSYEFCEDFKNIFPYRTPKLAASKTFASFLLIYGKLKNKNRNITLSFLQFKKKFMSKSAFLTSIDDFSSFLSLLIKKAFHHNYYKCLPWFFRTTRELINFEMKITFEISGHVSIDVKSIVGKHLKLAV